MPAENETRVALALTGSDADVIDDDEGSNAEGEDLEAVCLPFPLGLALDLVFGLACRDCCCWGGGVGVENTMERSTYRFDGEINRNDEVGSFARSGICSCSLDAVILAAVAVGGDKDPVSRIRQNIPSGHRCEKRLVAAGAVLEESRPRIRQEEGDG